MSGLSCFGWLVGSVRGIGQFGSVVSGRSLLLVGWLVSVIDMVVWLLRLVSSSFGPVC